MKLIREEIESVEFLVEQKNGKKSMYIEGVFLQGNIKNRNGRMYPMETLRREVSRYTKIMLLQVEHLVNLVIQMVLPLISIEFLIKLYLLKRMDLTLLARQRS